MNHEVPHKKEKSDKKYGINSTLLVLITVLIIARGEPYMMIENTVAASPQKSFLALLCRAKTETKATVEKIASTKVKRQRILNFSLLGANMMKINTYIASMAAPVPLMVETKMLFGDTKGRPYQAERRQLSKVMTYGMPENCSVLLFCMILLNVMMGAKKRNRAVAFPTTPKKTLRICIVFRSLSHQILKGKKEKKRNPAR